MPPGLALVVVGGLIVALFSTDRVRLGRIPVEWLLPLLYFFILASRLPSQWIGDVGQVGVGGVAEGNALDRAVYLALLIGSVVVLLRRPEGLGHLFAANWWLSVYVGYALLSIAWSDFPLVASKRWVRDLGLYTTAMVVAFDPHRSEAVRLLFRRLSYLAIPLSVVWIKYFPGLGRGFSPWTGEGYNLGIATSKNGLGALSLVCGLYLLWDCLDPPATNPKRRRDLGVNLLLLGAAVWLLYMSASATSQLCFLLGGLFLLASYGGRRWFAPRTVARVFVLAVLLYVPLNSLFDVTGEIAALVGRDASFTGRTDVWEDILRLAASPVVGTGYESYWLGERLAELWRLYQWRPNQAHNGYLEVFINLGAVGVVLVAMVMGVCYKRLLDGLAEGHAHAGLGMSILLTFILYNVTEAAVKSHVMWYALLVSPCALGALAPRPKRSPPSDGGRGSGKTDTQRPPSGVLRTVFRSNRHVRAEPVRGGTPSSQGRVGPGRSEPGRLCL